MSTPSNQIPYVPEGTLDPAAGLNLALDIIDALLQTRVISMALTTPPVSPNDGDQYIPASGSTGAWAGLDDYLVRYVADGDFWQDFEPGVQAHLALNLADGGFYKYIPGSPGGWTLAAGLSDAPTDGQQYLRINGMWQAMVGSLEMLTTESPPSAFIAGVTQLFIDPTRLELIEIGANTAMLTARKPFSPIVNISDANTDASVANSGNYSRFSHATATYTFDDAAGFEPSAEYHGRYVGDGTLTIQTAGYMQINPPADGTLVIPPGGTFTVKIVSATEADLIGVTEPA